MSSSPNTGSQSQYAIGHTRGATNAHSTRSAAKHAAFFLPLLHPDMKILDVGCGPGSITCDLADLVPSGHVTGVELSPAVTETAKTAAKVRGVENVTLQTGDVLKGLDFEDDAFDVVFCHQLLNHLSDPIAAIHEMKRVCKPTGFLALREGIMHVWYPDDPRLQDMDLILAQVMSAGGVAQPGAGKYLPAWAKEVGFTKQMASFTVNGTPSGGGGTRERMRAFFQDTFGPGSGLRGKAVLLGVEEQRIAGLYDAAMEWCDNEEAFQVLVCGEIVCRMSENV